MNPARQYPEPASVWQRFTGLLVPRLVVLAIVGTAALFPHQTGVGLFRMDKAPSAPSAPSAPPGLSGPDCPAPDATPGTGAPRRSAPAPHRPAPAQDPAC